MARPKKEIPLKDVMGLESLIEKGWSHERIAEYYHVDRSTISRRIKELK